MFFFLSISKSCKKDLTHKNYDKHNFMNRFCSQNTTNVGWIVYKSTYVHLIKHALIFNWITSHL